MNNNVFKRCNASYMFSSELGIQRSTTEAEISDIESREVGTNRFGKRCTRYCPICDRLYSKGNNYDKNIMHSILGATFRLKQLPLLQDEIKV